MDFIEHVQRNVYFCRQAGDKISEDKLVRYIITGLRGAEHLTHVSALLAMQMQGKKLTVRQIEKYFRKVSPSTNTQNIRTTYGRSNNIYAAPVSHSEVENAVLSHTEDDASTSTGNNTTSNSTSDDHNNINNNRMRNTLRNNGRGQPALRTVGVMNLLFNATDLSPYVIRTTRMYIVIHYSYQDANTVD